MGKNWTISTNNKKILKVFHITFAASMFGGLIAILVILMVKENCNIAAENNFGVDLSILKIFTWGVNYTFFALILTSFILGLFTEWGFAKYRWIISKWIITLSMFALTWFGLGPAINGMTSISDAGLNNSAMSGEYLNFQRSAIIFSVMETIAILLVFFVSVLKPLGARKVTQRIKQKTVVLIITHLIIIGIGFAAMNAIELNKIRNLPIKSINIGSVGDGTYNRDTKSGSYVYKVKAEVKNHRIVNIEGIDNRKSPYVSYAEGVFTKIIRQQKVDVDAITGATTTSEAFMKSVENALDK